MDGSHGNAGLDSLQFLTRLAKESDVRLTVAKNESDFDFRKEYRFLLISAPSRPFSDAFLETVTEFARLGGSIVLCGQADRLESGFHSAAQLNRLLSALGSTMKIQDDTAWDSVNSGKRPYQIYSDQINRDSSFCGPVNENQVYRMTPGSTVDPGSGTPLVEGRDTTGSRDLDKDGLGGSPEGTVTLLACETLSGGGTVFAAGSLFLADEALEEPGNIWDEPYANRTIAQVLLNIGKIPIPLSSIQDARSAKSGIPVRIRGYVTAGTANPHTTFPDTLYLQDDTGGMAVIPFRKADISIGTAMEFIGCVEDRHGNKVLKPTSSRVLDVSAYRYLPLTGKWNTLLDTVENEGRLIQVEGKCLKTTLRKDGTLETFLLEDSKGNRAKVTIDDGIFNGSDGKNTLHKSVKPGRTIRAMGILHIDADGTTVIRVRNCEEVVDIPPRKEAKPASKPDPSNPKTGDFPLAVMQ